MISGTRWGCSVSATMTLYNSLLVGLLRYTLPVMNGASKTVMKDLESAQAQALRSCLGLPKCTSKNGTLAEKAKLSHMTSSTAAELAAIRTAMQHIILQNPHQWVIFVDSKSALLALSSLRKQSPNIQLIHAIREIHQNALVKGHNIVLQWVPGHCGITGNICADNAAREAHKETATFLIPLSRTDSNTVTRSIGREITSSLWTDPHYYYKYLKHIDPKLEFCMPRNLSRAQETTLHRLRLNVAYTKKYLHLIGKEESPMC
ncbi:uncharacterized protein LOC121833795, partial [Ixodes scapularis]|uniref:uncharacterized protein LOC121833795 n=1 Tax=Ixodes scapularis TaxID=6945 RepID=UPI001C3860B9